MKKSLKEDVIGIAQGKYTEALNAGRAYLAPPPVDRRAVDSQLVRMSPDQMNQLSQTDPVAAGQAAFRLKQLETKTNALPPYNDEYQPE